MDLASRDQAQRIKNRLKSLRGGEGGFVLAARPALVLLQAALLHKQRDHFPEVAERLDGPQPVVGVDLPALHRQEEQLALHEAVLRLLQREQVGQDLSEGVHVEGLRLVELLARELGSHAGDGDIVVGVEVALGGHDWVGAGVRRLLGAVNWPMALSWKPLAEPKSMRRALPVWSMSTFSSFRSRCSSRLSHRKWTAWRICREIRSSSRWWQRWQLLARLSWQYCMQMPLLKSGFTRLQERQQSAMCGLFWFRMNLSTLNSLKQLKSSEFFGSFRTRMRLAASSTCSITSADSSLSFFSMLLRWGGGRGRSRLLLQVSTSLNLQTPLWILLKPPSSITSSRKTFSISMPRTMKLPARSPSRAAASSTALRSDPQRRWQRAMSTRPSRAYSFSRPKQSPIRPSACETSLTWLFARLQQFVDRFRCCRENSNSSFNSRSRCNVSSICRGAPSSGPASTSPAATANLPNCCDTSKKASLTLEERCRLEVSKGSRSRKQITFCESLCRKQTPREAALMALSRAATFGAAASGAWQSASAASSTRISRCSPAVKVQQEGRRRASGSLERRSRVAARRGWASSVTWQETACTSRAVLIFRDRRASSWKFLGSASDQNCCINCIFEC